MNAYASPLAAINTRQPAYNIRNKVQPSLILAMTGSAEYELLSQYIARIFQKAYGAKISVTYPLLAGLVDRDGGPLAAVGVRRALNESPLFLERYLDKPLEFCVQAVTGQRVPHHAIAEVGNLASSGKSDILLLLYSVTCHLEQEGISHILFTGTSSLKRYLHNLGLYPHVLAEADPTRLGADAACWGTYYDTRPKVMVGCVSHRHHISLPLNVPDNAVGGFWQC